VDSVALAALDDRERQYRRIDVTAAIELPPDADGGPVWAYVGRDAGRRRVCGRRGDGDVLIQRAYVERVEAGFAALGPDELSRYRASTEPPPFPVAELARVDLPV
jgi:hypothetical protein